MVDELKAAWMIVETRGSGYCLCIEAMRLIATISVVYIGRCRVRIVLVPIHISELIFNFSIVPLRKVGGVKDVGLVVGIRIVVPPEGLFESRASVEVSRAALAIGGGEHSSLVLSFKQLVHVAVLFSLLIDDSSFAFRLFFLSD